METKGFIPADESLFFRSKKTGDPRFGEVSQPLAHLDALNTNDFVIAGYPDDEGISLNNGRVGAKKGPDGVRSRLYKTSLSHSHFQMGSIYDIGNLTTDLSLEERHQLAKTICQHSLLKGARWVSIGGGHDYGYPDGAGFLEAQDSHQQKPLIINFDAHLDVRPLDKGLSSGTPFFRLLTEDKLPDFDLYQVGIQKQCNSVEHINWCQQKNVSIIFYEDLMYSSQSPCQYILSQLQTALTSNRPTFISMDIDCFSTAYAMGCSQAWPTGFSPNDLLPLLNELYKTLDVQALGIYEISPPLDLDERTVKLGAQLIHHFTGSGQ